MRNGATPGLAHQVAFLHVEKLYLASTAAIWWPDGLWEGMLDLAQLYSLSCLFRAPWGHWDAGEEPSEKMDSPPGSPFQPRRANQAGKGSAVYTACTSYPSHSFSPIPAPQRLCWFYSPCIPLRSIRSLTQYWAVLKPNAVSLCQHTPGSSAMPQCGTPGLTPPPHGLCSTNVVTSVSAMTCGSHLSCPP